VADEPVHVAEHDHLQARALIALRDALRAEPSRAFGPGTPA
jgi:GrpB-like predicted nucleotidyltransferase (UPF0157 family)